MRGFLVIALVTIITLGVSTKPVEAAETEFSLVVIPDTQMLVLDASARPDGLIIGKAITDWIINNSTAYNIKYTMHVGDITENYSQTVEWAAASTSFSRLLNYNFAPVTGNHDNNYGLEIPAVNFNSYFPVGSRAAATYQSGKGDYVYYRFSAAGLNWGILALGYTGGVGIPAEITWARGILTTYATDRIMVVTHSMITTAGALNADGTNHIWPIIKDKSNVFAVFCGHETNPSRTGRAEKKIQLTGDLGNTVTVCLANYQDVTPISGVACNSEGLIRLYKFFKTRNSIEAYTISPFYQSKGTVNPTTSFSWSYSMS